MKIKKVQELNEGAMSVDESIKFYLQDIVGEQGAYDILYTLEQLNDVIEDSIIGDEKTEDKNRKSIYHYLSEYYKLKK